jgi:hypothetical protein
MDFQLGIVDGLYKIQDVAIDNVSLVMSYRSEIASVLASHGGQIGALLTAMREERWAPLFGGLSRELRSIPPDGEVDFLFVQRFPPGEDVLVDAVN